MLFAPLLLAVAFAAPYSRGIDSDLAWVMTGQERVTWQLRDHEAVFQGSRTFRGTGYPVVCGSVSRANPIAYQRYIVVGESILLEARVGQPTFDFSWHEFCR